MKIQTCWIFCILLGGRPRFERENQQLQGNVNEFCPLSGLEWFVLTLAAINFLHMLEEVGHKIWRYDVQNWLSNKCKGATVVITRSEQYSERAKFISASNLSSSSPAGWYCLEESIDKGGGWGRIWSFRQAWPLRRLPGSYQVKTEFNFHFHTIQSVLQISAYLMISAHLCGTVCVIKINNHILHFQCIKKQSFFLLYRGLG